MYEDRNDRSLFADVLSGAEAGAALGKCVTGFAGAITGGLAGALTGCLYALVIKPFRLGEG